MHIALGETTDTFDEAWEAFPAAAIGEGELNKASEEEAEATLATMFVPLLLRRDNLAFVGVIFELEPRVAEELAIAGTERIFE